MNEMVIKKEGGIGLAGALTLLFADGKIFGYLN